MKPFVTVGLPFYNCADTVLFAVRSVLSQSYEDWRMILVDDGSTDGSLELLRRVRESRIVVISDGLNLGLARRLNQIAGLAESSLLARMDADDAMHPRRLEREVEVLKEAGGRALVCSDAISIDGVEQPTGYRRSVTPSTISGYFKRSPYIHPTLLGRTDWFRSNPYDATYRRCQDQELWVRTIGRRDVVTLDEPLLYLREAGTVSAAKYATSMAGTRRVLQDHGRERLGQAKTWGLLAGTFAKQTAYTVAERVRQADRLVHSRSESLSAAEQAIHRVVLDQIRATHLPGIDA